MSNKGQYVYFMRPVGMIGPIKIGCSMYVGQRLDTLSAWSPFKLEVIYTEKGSYKLEQDIHRCFIEYHAHREWFHPGERLLASIGKLLAGEKIATAIDFSMKGKSIQSLTSKVRRPPHEFQKELRSYQMRVMWAGKRAGKIAGDVRCVPDRINRILSAWEGSWKKNRLDGRRPSEEQFAELDAFIAAPQDHCLTLAQKYPKYPKLRRDPQGMGSAA